MYHIIEHIIGTEEDKAELQRCKDFNQYAKQRIFECLTEVGPVSDTEHADIFVKVDSQYDNYAVAEIEGFNVKFYVYQPKVFYVSLE